MSDICSVPFKSVILDLIQILKSKIRPYCGKESSIYSITTHF